MDQGKLLRREFLPTAAWLGGSLLQADDAGTKSAVLSDEATAAIKEVAARHRSAADTGSGSGYSATRLDTKDDADNIRSHLRDCSLVIRACRKQKLHKVEFRGNLAWAHESLLKLSSMNGYLRAGPLAVDSWIAAVNPWVDTLQEAGFTGVDINMGLFPWYNQDQATIAKIEKAIERIRRDGMRMAFNPEMEAWASGKLPDFEAYTREAVRIWSMLAKRFQPAVLMVAHEITTMRLRLGSDPGVLAWTEYLKRTAAAVKEASPNTLVGVGFVPGVWTADLQYARKWVSLPEMDLISVDFYGLRGFDRTDAVIRMAKAAGKRVFIEETWRGVYWPPEMETTFKGAEGLWDGAGVGMEKYQPIDALWMEMVAVYAAAWGMDAVVPFWTTAMIKYLPTDDWRAGFVYSPAYRDALVKALLNGERTKTFYAWKKLIQELGETRDELA